MDIIIVGFLNGRESNATTAFATSGHCKRPRRPSALRSIKIQGEPGADVIPMSGATSNLQAEEIFKIRGGKIHDVEAMGVSLPYGTKSGWEQ